MNSTFRLPVLGGFLIESIGAKATVAVFALWYLVMAVVTTFNRDVRSAPRLVDVNAQPRR